MKALCEWDILKFMTILSISVLIIILSGNALTLAAAGCPHIVFFKISKSDGCTPDPNNTHIYAYNLLNPDEVVDKSLPGCGCKIINTEGYVWFEIGNFKRPWSIEERMRVIAVSANETNEIYFQLNSSGFQNLAALTLEHGDNIGPICSNALADDSPSVIIAEGTASIALTATIDDSISGNTNIEAAEYYINSGPEMNTGMSILPGDEAFDGPKEEVKVIVNTSSWKKGPYVIYLRGKDAAENWGPADLVYVSVQSEKEGEDGGGDGGCFIDNF